eukprot:TRINITY_DN780141_c0_g1_i1.p1 TRINITY_DN780141_c0_g1~~TRINITY_DN780141_c0_g1_i1.p1  ORF type:complete len:428 (-),score=117.07 TRINITY_DN780141_c0_g1_i1:99-1382(-)
MLKRFVRPLSKLNVERASSSLHPDQHVSIAQGLTTQESQYCQTVVGEGSINFGCGQPSPSLLPLKEFQEACFDRFAKVGNESLFLQYGNAQGYKDFRQDLSEFLKDDYKMNVDPDTLFVTSGISQAIHLVASAYLKPKSTIFVEDPTYFLAKGIFNEAVADVNIIGIPVDENGMKMDIVQQYLDDGIIPDMIYTIPVFQNPCGVHLSKSNREEMVKMAYEHDFLILADEPYQMLSYFDEDVPACMASFDEGGDRVIALGSFSKILAPGLRLGWLQASEKHIKRLQGHGVLFSGGGLNPVMSGFVHSCIQTGILTDHISNLKSVYGERVRVLCDSLRKYIPDAEFYEPSGGYFVWVELPKHIETTRLLMEFCKPNGIEFAPGRRCAMSDKLSNCLRLSFAFYNSEEIEMGIQRLAECIEAYNQAVDHC